MTNPPPCPSNSHPPAASSKPERSSRWICSLRAGRNRAMSTRGYDRSGRLDIEQFHVSPAGRDPLHDHFESGIYGGFIGGGLSGGDKPLSADPETIREDLNEWVALDKPGRYSLYVTSGRVSRTMARKSRMSNSDRTRSSSMSRKPARPGRRGPSAPPPPRSAIPKARPKKSAPPPARCVFWIRRSRSARSRVNSPSPERQPAGTSKRESSDPSTSRRPWPRSKRNCLLPMRQSVPILFPLQRN